jgi:hypothetical protein
MDAWDITNAGNSQSGLNAVPSDGTVVEGLPSGDYWEFSSGELSASTPTSTAVQVNDSSLLSFLVELTSQDISWPSEPTSGTYGEGVTLSAAGGGSGNPVVFSIDDTSQTGVCSVSGTDGTSLSYTGVGTCVVDANQAGNIDYSAAPELQDSYSVAACKSSATRCFTSAPSKTVAVGSQFSLPVTTFGTPTPTITEKGKLPTGVTFNKVADTLSGTPGTKTGGLYPVTLTATFGAGKTKVVLTQSFTLTIDAPPIITSKTTLHATNNVAFKFTVQTGYGYPPSAPAMSDSTLPPGATLDDLGNGTAIISGMLGTGTYVSTIDATNTTGTGSQTFTIVVKK